MVRWRAGSVTRLRGRWPGAVELDVALERRAAADPDRVRALAYPALVGDPRPGDRVLLNLNALATGLGTGGYALVVALPDRLPPDADDEPIDDELPGDDLAGDEQASAAEAPGEPIVKARYTPLQVLSHARITTADHLEGMPVVVAELHSAVPAVVAGILANRPGARVAYVMGDGGSLVAAFSRTLAGLAPLLCGVVTVGQAFGGDLEEVTVHSGLLAARHALRADVAVVAPGPGSLGTGTKWGFSGIAVGEVVNAAATLGGRPVGALRISGADPRARHRGLSHHCLITYGKVALCPADLALPLGLPKELDRAVRTAVASLAPPHRMVEVDTTGLNAALRELPITLSTMGRGLDEDPAYFLAAAAAGRHAATS